MGDIIEYQHHGCTVKVDEDLKGKHRQHCLCHRGCQLYHPDTPYNCAIAIMLFNLCKQYGLTTPVYECPLFKEA